MGKENISEWGIVRCKGEMGEMTVFSILRPMSTVTEKGKVKDT